MLKKPNVFAMFLLMSSCCCPSTWAQARKSTTASIVYDVTMLTSMTVPANRKIEQVRVWHALPTPRPWFEEVDVVSWRPSSGEREYNKEHDSHHVFFRNDIELASNQRITFETKFQVVSQRREFEPRNSKTKWSDIEQKPNPSGNTKVKAFAQMVRKAQTPAKALLMATQLINKQMEYDANVSYSSLDLERTLANKRGHCGHYFTLLEAVCEELQIQIRVVRGLNLYCPDGVSSELHKVRADYTNIHTWAEVYLPKDGWIEMEPTESEFPFKLEANLIQNNAWFQNYAVWFRENGKDVFHDWKHVNGRYQSDFDLAHKITYTIQPFATQKSSR